MTLSGLRLSGSTENSGASQQKPSAAITIIITAAMSLEDEIVYASLATLRKGRFIRPVLEASGVDDDGVVFAELQNVFDLPTCVECGNLLDETVNFAYVLRYVLRVSFGRTHVLHRLEQPAIVVATAIVRYSGDVAIVDPPQFDLDDFETLMLYEPIQNVYHLPSSRAQTGERLVRTANRAIEKAFDGAVPEYLERWML